MDILIILLVIAVTVTGVLSFSTSHSYEVTNQYGDIVKMWGYGIYKYDSFFKAPLFIGSDLTILLLVVPLSIMAFVRARKEQSVESLIGCFGNLALLLYYSASLAFGVTYNNLHLMYILLFGLCFFGAGSVLLRLNEVSVKQNTVCTFRFTKGLKAFLLISGVSLFVAWLPDIIKSLAKGRPLELIEVYTTEVTYVLDMGIISPLMFIAFFLVRKGSFIGYVLLRMILKVCICVGIMLPVQTFFQLLAGIDLPIFALITKVFIFVLLAVFAAVLQYRLKKGSEYSQDSLLKQ